MEYIEILQGLTDTDLPNWLVILGVGLLFLAVIRKISTVIELEHWQQILAGVIGILSLSCGITLHVMPYMNTTTSPSETNATQSSEQVSAMATIEAAQAEIQMTQTAMAIPQNESPQPTQEPQAQATIAPTNTAVPQATNTSVPTQPIPTNTSMPTQSIPTATPVPLPTADTSIVEPSQSQPFTNLVRNSGFEEPIQGNWVSGGQIGIETSHNGSNALCSAQSDTNDGFLWVGIEQTLTVNSGQSYNYAAWLKWENAAQVHLQVQWRGNSGVGLGESFSAGPFDGNSNGWIEKGGIIQAPQNATTALIRVWHGVVNNSSKVPGSKICIDDVVFSPL